MISVVRRVEGLEICHVFIYSIVFKQQIYFSFLRVLKDDHLSKTTTFEWSQGWSPHTGLTVFLVNSTHNVSRFRKIHFKNY